MIKKIFFIKFLLEFPTYIFFYFFIYESRLFFLGKFSLPAACFLICQAKMFVNFEKTGYITPRKLRRWWLPISKDRKHRFLSFVFFKLAPCIYISDFFHLVFFNREREDKDKIRKNRKKRRKDIFLTKSVIFRLPIGFIVSLDPVKKTKIWEKRKHR